MAETINWSVNFNTVLGPRISAAGTQVVDAYDKLNLQLDANAVDVDFDLQPSGTGGDVDLLIMRSSSYEAAVTFSADSGANSFTLNGPVVLIGSGSVALLADPPQALRFSNPSADPIDIDILVGRQA